MALLHEDLGRRGVTDIALFLTTRPGTLTGPVLSKLMDMGLIRLFMGVESSTVEGYRSLGRQQSPAEVESAFELCGLSGKRPPRIPPARTRSR